MTDTTRAANLLAQLDHLNEQQLRRLLVEHLTKQKLGLFETKENTKDAERKAERIPKCYGKVLFLTKDQNLFRVINDDGSKGDVVDYDDLLLMQEWLRASKPTVQ